MNKKFMAMLLALVMIVSIVPMAAMAEEEHEHDYAAVSNNDGTHTLACSCGASFAPMNCGDYNGDNYCDSCGYLMYAPKCTHEDKGVVNKGETHDLVCRECETVLATEEHSYSEYGVCVCGAVEPTPVCDHEGGAWISNGDGTHTSSCECGENTVTGECQNIDGKCYMCGYDMSHECDYDAGVTSNEDGTHNVNCSCGNFVTVNCLDNDGDGKCDSCGYVKYVHECSYEDKIVSNENGTHNCYCSCRRFITEDCQDQDKDGKCDSCGYAIRKPGKPAADSNLDNVPKTGDNGIAMILSGILFFGAMGFAAYIQADRKKYI